MGTDSGRGGGDELAGLLAAHPSSVARLLAEHVDDGTGHCSVCSAGPQGGRMGWPCRLADLAAAARKQMPR